MQRHPAMELHGTFVPFFSYTLPSFQLVLVPPLELRTGDVFCFALVFYSCAAFANMFFVCCFFFLSFSSFWVTKGRKWSNT